MPELTLQQAFELALAHHQAGRLAEAESIYRQILAVEPNQPDALHLLGVLARQVDQPEVAIDLIRRALAIKPAWAEALNNLGLILYDHGQWDEAIRVCQQAIALKPDYGKAYNNLGNLLKAKGFLDEALAAYQQALLLKQDLAEVYNNLGNVFLDKRQLDQAVAAYQESISINPQYTKAYNNLGNALHDQGQVDRAIAAYHEALLLEPNLAAVSNNLGFALVSKGQIDQALAAYRRASALVPMDSLFQSNYLFALQYHPGADDSSIAAELRRWEQQFAEPLHQTILPHANDRSPERRLRIGYLSPDLREHSVGHFLLPLLEHHDRAQYEIFAYAQVTVPDALTEQLRGNTETWRSIVGMSDAAVAELIRKDQIDILVDLALHTAGNRLLVFARKPAPVQVAYLAYVGSSGLATMDYRLSDAYLDPPGQDESIYSEATVRLGGTYWCYRPTELASLPVVGKQNHAPLQFGCLNNFCKINEPLIALWAEILQAVPDSRLLLHAYVGDHRQQMLDRFATLGIDAERIDFVGRMPRAEYFQTYQSLDISLDTLPFAGGTTTCDSLWMGVPVVTLAGKRAVGRSGVSILSNVGLPELIAQTPEEYVQIAVALANDRPRLQELHSTLRERMQASPLMDGAKYARHVEAAYRQMWRTWCAQR